MKSHIETRLVDFEGRVDANGLADLGIIPLGADQKTCKQKLRTKESAKTGCRVSHLARNLISSVPFRPLDLDIVPW